MWRYWDRVFIKMADESSVLPIWCDVGKNLNAVSLVVGLGRFTKGKPVCGGKSKQIVRIYPRKLIFDCHEAVDDSQGALKNTVHYPGKVFCLLLFMKEWIEILWKQVTRVAAKRLVRLRITTPSNFRVRAVKVVRNEDFCDWKFSGGLFWVDLVGTILAHLYRWSVLNFMSQTKSKWKVDFLFNSGLFTVNE